MQGFFDGWLPLGRTLVVGICAYVALILVLRVSGTRTLSKMNAFDFVVTIALGSTLATILLSRDVSLAQGVTAFVTLIGLQFAISWSIARAPGLRSVVTGEPTLLLYRGGLLEAAMRRSRVVESEVHAALRSAGLSSVGDVAAVVLGTDGSLSVVHALSSSPASALPFAAQDLE